MLVNCAAIRIESEMKLRKPSLSSLHRTTSTAVVKCDVKTFNELGGDFKLTLYILVLNLASVFIQNLFQ